VILIVALVLLVPIRYDIKARYADGIKAKLGVHWLLKMIHVKLAAINAQILVRIKLFGFTLKKLHVGNWGEEENAADGADPQISSDEGKTDVPAESKKKGSEEAADNNKKTSEAPKEKPDEFDALFEKMKREREEKEARKKKHDKTNVTDEEKTPPEEAEKISGKKVSELLQKAEDFLDDEKNQYTIHLINRQLLKVGKHLLPTHFLVDGRLGLDNPAATGELIGKIYRFYPLYGDHIRLEGVYDHPETNIYTEIKGRIRLGIFVEVAVRLLLNKNFRHWLKFLLKKEKTTEVTENNTQTEPNKAAA